MKMSNELANALMDALACLAISANGGVEVDENGEPIMTEEQEELVLTYARSAFTKICEEWEEEMGEKWEIEMKGENENENQL